MACSTCRRWKVDRQREQDHDYERQVAPVQGGRRKDDGRRREVRQGGRRLQGQGRSEELARELLLLDEEHAGRREGQGQDLGGRQVQSGEGHRRRALMARGQPARAKNSLENYCYSMKNTLGDEKVK